MCLVVVLVARLLYSYQLSLLNLYDASLNVAKELGIVAPQGLEWQIRNNITLLSVMSHSAKMSLLKNKKSNESLNHLLSRFVERHESTALRQIQPKFYRCDEDVSQQIEHRGSVRPGE